MTAEETNERIEENETAGQDSSGQVQTENTETTDPYEEDLNLSEGVSLSPRNDEEADMRNIHPEGWDVYLRSSDDAGELLGDTDLEGRVRDVCTRLNNSISDGQEVEDGEALIAQIHEMSDTYSDKIEKCESYCHATIVKYGIQWGQLLNLEKELVRKFGTQWDCKWEEYFNEKYSPTKRRSAIVYMKWARVKRAKGYSALKYDPLTFIMKQSLNLDSEDPIGDWLRDHGIVFNPSNPDEVEECLLKVQAIADHRMLEKKGHNVDKDQLLQLRRMGVKLKDHTKNLDLLKKYSGDTSSVQQYLDSLVQNQGEQEPDSNLTNFRRVESFNRAASVVAEAAENYLNGEWPITSLDATQVIGLKEKLTALSAMVAEQE